MLQEIKGRSPGVLFQDPAAFEKLLGRASVSDLGQVERTDINLIHSAGEAYLADINLVRLLDADNLVGYLLVIEDITRKKAFPTRSSIPKSLQRLEQWQGRFA